MAKRVYDQEEISLQDDMTVTLRPLPIGRLRRFMKAWEEFASVQVDEEGFDVFINCAGIALEENFTGKFEKITKEERDAGQHLSSEYKEYLEDVLDLETIYKILEVAGGIKLNDPKLLEMAQEIQNPE